MVHQVGSPLGHPPTAAAPAEASPLARKCDQSIRAAVAAPEPGESPGQPPAPEERLELFFDKARQALTIAEMDGLCPERLEVVAHHVEEHASTRVARDVLDRRSCHPIA